jgi:phospholipid transport system substrate-binding protein
MHSIRRSAAPLLALCALTLSLITTAGPARSEVGGPSYLISTLGTRAIAIVHETLPQSSARFGRFQALVAESFDVPVLAEFVTGKYWETATPDERQRFTAAFGTHVTELVTARFAHYQQQSFTVLGERAGADGSAVVSSEVVDPKATQADRVDWQVAKTDAGFRIRDVSVSGVSIVQAKRAEFVSMLMQSRGGIAALAAVLERRAAQQAKND